MAIAFLEFAVDADACRDLGVWLERLGFVRIGRHRSKEVSLYRQGQINLILNAEPDSFAHSYFQLHGPSLCAVALRTDHEQRALERAREMRATRIDGRVGPNERTIAAVRAIDGSLYYFIAGDEGSAEPFDTDFFMEPVPAASNDVGLKRVDHVALAIPADAMDTWILFYRAVLGLEPQPVVEMAELYGLMRSRAVVDRTGHVRVTLNASDGRNSMMARSLTAFAGPGVHHVALTCEDIFQTVRRLASRRDHVSSDPCQLL